MNDKFILLPSPREMSLTGELTLRPFDQLKRSAGIDPEKVEKQQGYFLEVSKESITIVAHDEAGLFYANKTVEQIVQQFPKDQILPCLEIEDWPDFPVRGIMLDISRDKIPTMDSLYALIDLYASWKINQLHLYTEHTFAYKAHKKVWADASPITPEQMRALDAYCRERFIERVPFQSSFGHMHRWLKHDEYKSLAECPEGWDNPFTLDKEPFTLCPTDNRTISFLNTLYDELLENCSSKHLAVGLDETLELGFGRSKAICEEKGIGRVYLDFLNRLNEEVSRRGLTMMYFGDMIMQYPELIPELPKDAIALHWGYGAQFQFDKDCKHFADANVPFYVAPSNSTYRSVGGRTKRAMANIRNAVKNGLKHGALGVLNTEWGDCGHWQPQSTSYLGFAYGAALSWAYEANVDKDISDALNRHVFLDKNGLMGGLAYDIGNLFLLTSSSDLFPVLQTIISDADKARSEWPFNELTVRDLKQTQKQGSHLASKLSDVDLQSPDGPMVLKEYDFALQFIDFACELGRVWLSSNAQKISDLPKEKRAVLHESLMELISIFKDVWHLRNREGGLTDSLRWFDKAQESLEASEAL